MITKLRLTGQQHTLLQKHLFPGDGKEAVAVLKCGRFKSGAYSGFLVNDMLLVPHDSCARAADRISWSPKCTTGFLEQMAKSNCAIVKIHSHPGGWEDFSDIDDTSDKDFFSSVYGWTDSDDLHASAIMVPGGKIIARTVDVSGKFSPVDLVSVAGNDLKIWTAASGASSRAGFAQRHTQLFGSETVARLQQLSVAVIGCSGTGSPLIEMLARLGVGRLVLVDPDKVEVKNLNRIYNATREDAILSRYKTEVLGRAIARMGLGTEVELFSTDLATRAAVRAVSSCDVAFGCMDGARGRSLLNRICTYYSIPYLDLGVRLDADGEGGISEAMGAVHYIQPDGSSLRDRGVFSAAQLKAESLRHTDADEYEKQLRSRYITNANEDRPAVISINTQTAAIAVNEFLARLHPYRYAGNEEFASVRMSFIHGEWFHAEDKSPVPASLKYVGLGDQDPLLDMPALSE